MEWVAISLYGLGMGPWAVMAQERGRLWTWRGAFMVFLWPVATVMAGVAAIHDMISES